MSAAMSQASISELTMAPPADQAITVRRSGTRPMTFAGVELCSAMSYEPGTPLWYEINIYRTSGRSFVAAVKMFSKSEDERDRFSACEADSLDEIAYWLESYEPAHDIRADIPVDHATMPVIELGIKAAAAGLKLAEARRQYRDLVGEVLYALEKR